MNNIKNENNQKGGWVALVQGLVLVLGGIILLLPTFLILFVAES